MAILQLSEAGELAYLRSKWWASSCLAERAKSFVVQAHSLKGIFLVLSIGLGLGALVAVLELISQSRRSAAEQKVSFLMMPVSRRSICKPSESESPCVTHRDGFLCAQATPEQMQ